MAEQTIPVEQRREVLDRIARFEAGLDPNAGNYSNGDNWDGTPSQQYLDESARIRDGIFAAARIGDELAGGDFNAKWSALGKALKSGDKYALPVVVSSFSDEEKAIAIQLLGGEKELGEANPFKRFADDRWTSGDQEALKGWTKAGADVWDNWDQAPGSLGLQERGELVGAWDKPEAVGNAGTVGVRGGADSAGNFQIPEAFLNVSKNHAPPPTRGRQRPQMSGRYGPAASTGQPNRPQIGGSSMPGYDMRAPGGMSPKPKPANLGAKPANLSAPGIGGLLSGGGSGMGSGRIRQGGVTGDVKPPRPGSADSGSASRFGSARPQGLLRR